MKLFCKFHKGVDEGQSLGAVPLGGLGINGFDKPCKKGFHDIRLSAVAAMLFILIPSLLCGGASATGDMEAEDLEGFQVPTKLFVDNYPVASETHLQINNGINEAFAEAISLGSEPFAFGDVNGNSAGEENGDNAGSDEGGEDDVPLHVWVLFISFGMAIMVSVPVSLAISLHYAGLHYKSHFSDRKE